MKKILEIENDLAVPLTNSDVEWNLYLYKKRYKKKILETYDMYRINNIDLSYIYNDIHNHIVTKFLNVNELCDYSPEMPKNKIGFIDLTSTDNVLNTSLPMIKDGIKQYSIFDSKDMSLHGYILECKIDGETYMRLFTTSNPIKFFKNKYSIISKNSFEELQKPILSISTCCDCITLNDYALFFTNKAESVFDLEKHYKALATTCLSDLKTYNLFADFESFSSFASCWPKAAKFENFNKERIATFSSLSLEQKTKIFNTFSIKQNENRSHYF